jgi:tripartite-type tricarboxylate transporter receptor subunit TctC
MANRYRQFMVFAVTAMLAVTTHAQTFPAKPVRIVVPAAPGGATDSFSRALAARLGERWGQPVLVENRPGGNQMIGAEAVVKAAPDGHTLFVSDASTFVMNPHLHRKITYDGVSSFTPITVLVSFPWVIAVNVAVPANSFEELVALSKAKPGTLTYGSFGTSSQINFEALNKQLGTDFTHVPYKGAAPAVTDLLSGQISMIMVTPLLVEPHARAGKLKLIAAATPVRIPRLPQVPTVAESGAPGYEAGTWFGLVGPANMPEPLVAQIYTDTMQVLNDAAFRDQHVTRQWFQVVGNTPADFAVQLKAEHARWGDTIRRVGMKPE